MGQAPEKQVAVSRFLPFGRGLGEILPSRRTLSGKSSIWRTLGAENARERLNPLKKLGREDRPTGTLQNKTC